MEENFTDLTDPAIWSDNNIRIIQTTLQSKLVSVRKKVSEATLKETYNICQNVRDKVLNSEDEHHLTKTQNNCRRISIASELFIDICSTYEFIVDYEFSKIIDNLMQWKKYKHLSKKITQKMKLQSKKEKYFVKEAQNKLQKCLEGRTLEASKEVTPKHSETTTEKKLTEAIEKDISAKESVEQRQPLKEQEHMEDKELSKKSEHVEAVYEESHADEVMRPTLEYSVRETSNLSGNFTELRANSITGSPLLQYPTTLDQREVQLFPSAISEIAIRKSNLQEYTEDDISQILEILKEEIVEKQINEIEKLETKSTDKIKETSEDILTQKTLALDKNQLDFSEDSEEWSLPALEPIERPQKKPQQLIIDPATVIHNYSRRALYLNSSIKIQRVQVFEGPPDVLNAMSVNHLMGTPSFKGSVFRGLRSSVLSKLFKRHLIVEQKPVEPKIVPVKSNIEEPKEFDISKIRENEEILEEIGMKARMRSLPVQANVLAESTNKKSHLDDTVIEIPANIVGKESLIGRPMSRIFGSALQPPHLEALNMPVLQSPRAQQLQGRSFDPETHSLWFHSTGQNPPSPQYKEFNYVYKKIQEYWLLSEIQGMEKSITLKEFFRFEMNGGIENFLTVLRIVDKLSIQKKLILEYRNQNVLICPFEFPFVSEKHLLLREKKPIL